MFNFNPTDTGTLLNSLLTACPLSSPLTLSHSATNSSSSGIYANSGAGNYYLAAFSTNHNAGATNIDPVLLADLKSKTTYPPLIYSNITIFTNLTLAPQAQRESAFSPDIGYAYDPLDFLTDTRGDRLSVGDDSAYERNAEGHSVSYRAPFYIIGVVLVALLDTSWVLPASADANGEAEYIEAIRRRIADEFVNIQPATFRDRIFIKRRCRTSSKSCRPVKNMTFGAPGTGRASLSHLRQDADLSRARYVTCGAAGGG